MGWLFRRWWWLILTPAVVAAALAGGWAWQRAPLYTSEGSYVVRADVADASDLVRATVALTDTDDIVSTYARIARSSLIAGQARERLGLTEAEANAVEVTSSVVPDANLVLIGARSGDPRLARAMATSAGELTEAYVRAGNDAYLLVGLDAPTRPGAPSSRGVGGMIALGGAAGLAVGLGLAVAAERGLPSAPPRGRLREAVDERSHAYNRRYLGMRLHEEISRSGAPGHRFSVGVLQVLRRRPHGAEAEDLAALTDAQLRSVNTCIRETLREQDILGHLGQGRFAAILPNVEINGARALVQEWRRSIAPALLRDRMGRDFMVSVAACQFERSGFVGDPEAELIVSTL